MPEPSALSKRGILATFKMNCFLYCVVIFRKWNLTLASYRLRDHDKHPKQNRKCYARTTSEGMPISASFKQASGSRHHFLAAVSNRSTLALGIETLRPAILWGIALAAEQSSISDADVGFKVWQADSKSSPRTPVNQAPVQS